MCAFNAALDFGKDMIELSASTLGTLVGIQVADLATFLEHQSVALYRIADARDVAALVALQREYRDTFWNDRRTTLTATTEALQSASRVAAKSWSELVSESDAIEATPVATVKRKPAVVAHEQADEPAPSAAASTKGRKDDAGSKLRANRSRMSAKTNGRTKGSAATTPPGRKRVAPPEEPAAAAAAADPPKDPAAADLLTHQNTDRRVVKKRTARTEKRGVGSPPPATR